MWHKVDDGLHSHRKARAVRRSDPAKRRDSAPFGLWVLAGSWCGDNSETNGFIPLEILEEWDDDAESLARRLVAAGLWIEATQDGEVGYLFHDYEDYNPVDPSASGAFGNHVRWHVNAGVIKAGCEHCESGSVDPESPPIIAPESGATSPPESPPDRSTRPDPTRPDPKNTARSARGDAARFEEFWTLYPRKVGKGKAKKAWPIACKKASPDQIIAALREQIPGMNMQRRTDGDYRPHPTTWLNGERWLDDAETYQAAAGGDESYWSRPL